MSNITVDRPLGSYSLADWAGGSVTLLNSTHVQLSNGTHSSDLYGVFTYNSVGISVTPSCSGYKVTTPGKTDILNSIERIETGDGSALALDVKAGENTSLAYRAYQAAFAESTENIAATAPALNGGIWLS